MQLDLYKYDTCPFCQRVMGAIRSSGRTDVTLHDIHENEEDRKYLVEKGGKQQVPCLFIDGEPMYESGDIIAWLSAHPQQ